MRRQAFTATSCPYCGAQHDFGASPSGESMVSESAAAPAPSQKEESPILAPGPKRSAWERALAFGAAAVLVGVLAGLWLPWDIQWPSGGASAQESGSIAAVQPDSQASIDSVVRTPPSRASDNPAPAAGEPPLVDVRSVDPTIQVDMRYATADNFTGAPLPGYEASRALLHPEVATALGRVQARLRRDGLGLRVFDAYRPVRATLAMVDWAKRNGRQELLESGFIGRRSSHNLGLAVDVTLVDLEAGTAGSAGRDQEILVRTMESEGFSTLDQASYHFVYELEGAKPMDRVIR